MDSRELAFAPAGELRDRIATKEISPVELVDFFLERIERLNSKLNAYITVAAEQARRDAEAAERAVKEGRKLGILHGVPISIKDLELTKGLRTTFGSLVFKDFIPEQDSLIVGRLREAGAIILGKTNTPEFGCAGTTSNRLGDDCRNPWDVTRTPGGSSGGAGAAMAAGLCPLAQGSDGGGSIRIPSSFSGVYGLKPTLGRIPRSGGKVAAANYLSAVGPMSRTVRDSALLMQAVAGHSPADPLSIRSDPPDYLSALDGDVKGLRIAWSPNLGHAPVDPEVERIVAKAASVFSELGCQVDDSPFKIEDPSVAFFSVFFATVCSSLPNDFYERQKDLLTDYFSEFFERTRKTRPEDILRGLHGFESLTAKMASVMKSYDIILTPTMPVPAFPIGSPPKSIAGREVDSRWGWLPFTFPFNMTGQPAASIPCGFSSSGVPVGLQMIGRWNEERVILSASAAFEKTNPWTTRTPPVS